MFRAALTNSIRTATRQRVTPAARFYHEKVISHYEHPRNASFPAGGLGLII